MVSCEGLGNGGVQAIMMGIVRNLYTECHFDMLLFTSEKRYYDDEFLKYGGKIFRVPKYEGGNCLLHRADYYVRDFYTYREVNKILKNEPPYDVIHCNREYENAPLLMLASKYNVSVRISQAHIIHGKTNVICTLLNTNIIFYNQIIHSFIDTYFLALFFFISGLLVKDDKVKCKGWLKMKAVQLLIPFICIFIFNRLYYHFLEGSSIWS